MHDHRDEISMILGVPTLCRYDLLDKLLASAVIGSLRPSRYIIIDNGGGYDAERARQIVGGSTIEVSSPGKNLGVSASWNLLIDAAEGEPVLISNDDVILSQKSVEHFTQATKTFQVVISDVVSFALFTITTSCIKKVGWFDENFWPAYFEDIDYNRRVMLHRVPIGVVPPPFFHGVASTRKSMSTSEVAYIDEGHHRNLAYYTAKWGGAIHNEKFTEPFDGHPPPGWKER